MPKCQKDATCGIFLKRGLFKGIKNYIPIQHKLEHLSFAQLYLKLMKVGERSPKKGRVDCFLQHPSINLVQKTNQPMTNNFLDAKQELSINTRSQYGQS